jgi:ABC-type Mn2+/Zn2+ transport system ATPase subunit
VTAIRLARAAVGYGGPPVVDGLDLTLASGTMLALVGTNGSGKSTILKTLAGLLGPRGGSVEVLGAQPGGAPERLAYLAQFHVNGLLLPIKASEVVRMGRFAGKGLLGRLGDDDRAAVAEALDAIGIRDLAQRPLRDLSGGQKQRVFIAQALARRADVLLLDEPAAGLDAASRELLAAALENERKRGAAVVVATHDLADAMRSDLVMLLARRVVALGSPAAVLRPETLRQTFGIALHTLAGGVLVMDSAHGHGEHDPVGLHEH